MSLLDAVPTYSNRSERLPCVLVLDASGSMSGAPIGQLNAALRLFADDLKSDEDAKKKVRVLVISVQSAATVVSSWVDAEDFNPPHLAAEGSTALGEGARLALTEVRSELARLREAGIARKKPWVWVFTDGEPTDNGWEQCATELRDAHKRKEVLVFPIAVGSANVANLARFEQDGKVYQVAATNFKELFAFISSSARSGSAQPEPTVMPLFSQIAAT